MTMRTTRRAMLALVLLVLTGDGAYAQAPNAEADVRAADAQRFAAMVARDRQALERLLADDLTYTHSTGQVESKAQFLESIAAGGLVYQAIDPEEVAVRVYGETAVVTGRASLRVESRGQALVLPVRFTSVYVRKDGLWRLAAWQSTRLPEPSKPPSPQ
ncbi:MAG TPA: nuclear transport factor 2 family protein [Thermoanaerobaculia bacterium]|nr:nuclear transport factor 2 family protein [Thermoanaerobaculia bacterium]